MSQAQTHIEKIKAEHAADHGMRLGDFVRINGALERISLIQQDGQHIQCTLDSIGSWFMWHGGVQFSGTGCNLMRPGGWELTHIDDLRLVGTMDGYFWTFKDGQVGPNRREDFKTVCRVYELIKVPS